MAEKATEGSAKTTATKMSPEFVVEIEHRSGAPGMIPMHRFKRRSILIGSNGNSHVAIPHAPSLKITHSTDGCHIVQRLGPGIASVNGRPLEDSDIMGRDEKLELEQYTVQCISHF
ncbi:MAG: hypothetical protein WC289_00745 [Patescibacteria group bacterium]|jgi:hypothetical protein